MSGNDKVIVQIDLLSSPFKVNVEAKKEPYVRKAIEILKERYKLEVERYEQKGHVDESKMMKLMVMTVIQTLSNCLEEQEGNDMKEKIKMLDERIKEYLDKE